MTRARARTGQGQVTRDKKKTRRRTRKRQKREKKQEEKDQKVFVSKRRPP
jgi:hypothetical protein